MTDTKYFDDVREAQCSKCQADLTINDSMFDYADNETHSVTCEECGTELDLYINRPIEMTLCIKE